MMGMYAICRWVSSSTQDWFLISGKCVWFLYLYKKVWNDTHHKVYEHSSSKSKMVNLKIWRNPSHCSKSDCTLKHQSKLFCNQQIGFYAIFCENKTNITLIFVCRDPRTYATTYPNVHTPGLQLNIQFRSFCICLLDPSNEVAKCDFISISFTTWLDLNTCIVDRLHSVSNDLPIMMEFANEIR